MGKTTFAALLLAIFVLSSLSGLGTAEREEPVGQTFEKIEGPDTGIRVIPENFLRGYDPITVFFDEEIGPTNGGPLDDPRGILEIAPAHPGEYRYLDAKTAQFLPAIPWPPLSQFSVSAGEARTYIPTLMMPPERVSPSSSSDMEPLETFSFTFPYAIDPGALARMITFEVRPLPGVGDEQMIRLNRNDFTIKVMEQNESSSGYYLTLASPIGYGKHVTVSFGLSDDLSLPGEAATYTYRTKPQFAVKGMGSGSIYYPIAANGSIYTREQTLDGGTGDDPLFIEFSESIASLPIETVKRFVTFEPAVRNLQYRVSGNRLYLSMSVDRGTAYKATLHEAPIASASGRVLGYSGESSFYFNYTQLDPYLAWSQSQGILERYGPQYLPMEGRALERVDFRIYEIDPLSRNFWPFPSNPVRISENARPPMPGEEPAYGTQLASQIRLIGSPPVSDVFTLPINENSPRSAFGFDLRSSFEKISGEGAPGTYLIGYRVLDASTNRYYVRYTVTDLSLSTIEEEHSVRFVVTSLKTGAPVEGAEVRVDVEVDGRLEPRIQGVTDATGQFVYEHTERVDRTIMRIVVQHGDDVLVLDPSDPPPQFRNNHWFGSSSRWLGWLNRDPREELARPKLRGHIMSERPIYRPDETVHLIGYVRQRRQGKIEEYTGDHSQTVVIRGPGRQEWSFPVELSSLGHFYIRFDAEDLPSGSYFAQLLDSETSVELASVQFKKEAYRIPRFEIQVSGPDKVPLDRPFSLVLTADYYAGGRVVGQEVTWEITQYPIDVRPASLPGFIFSSDRQFTDGRRFQVRGTSFLSDVTDENGSSTLELDPSIEEDGMPRRYVAEATVRGADTQTVTTVKEVSALPAFMIGLKIDRFISHERVLRPRVVVIGHDEKPVGGKQIIVRFYQRQWHSYLVESDFTTGEAKYVSDVVDTSIFEKEYTTSAEILELAHPVEEPGVYVVEVLGLDHLGRMQRVQKDLYIAGDDGGVAWEKPDGNIFETTLDKAVYAPGDTATMLLKSPFQHARALVILERPSGSAYEWVDVSGGQGLFSFEVTSDMTPRLPVHALLMRGRLSGTGSSFPTAEDRGKPVTMASTTWAQVDPTENQATVELEHPETCLPGDEITVSISMKDNHGEPLSGAVALWLVDRAVLSLAREEFGSPLDRFIDPVTTHLSIRETRNEVVGNLPVREIPGGGGMEEVMAAMSVMERVTVRKTFKSVPYFNDSIEVVDGTARVTIEMPENLTEFAIRAVAISGFDRFGIAKSKISVRLPVIVQSALPRFVRPGDSFLAGGIGRIVEGPGGPGAVEIAAEGIEIGDGGGSSAARPVTWDERRPQQLFFPMNVPAGIDPDRREVSVRMAVERSSDRVGDGFEAILPVGHDSERGAAELLVPIKPGATVAIPQPEEPVREGSLKRRVVITPYPMVARMLSGLRFLARYEYG